MVRLVDYTPQSIIDFITSFNSTMVRLVVKERENYLLSAVFQFHYGTIGRGKGLYDLSREPGFNSTMVRLVVQGL